MEVHVGESNVFCFQYETSLSFTFLEKTYFRNLLNK
jgi:hypothetical protein